MTNDERDVHATVMRFYDALEQMIEGNGTGAMQEVWLHGPRVTSSHPMEDWARGWDEILATWEVFATFGKKGNGGTKVESAQVYVYGDFAYATVVFIAAPTWGSGRLNVTNILQRIDGAWKIIHHHPDKAPIMAAHMEKIMTD